MILINIFEWSHALKPNNIARNKVFEFTTS